MQRIRLRREPRLDAKHEAFAYQLEAFTAIEEAEYAAIFHEQGLGKTKIAIDLLLHWLETKEVDTVLVVAKRGLVTNWERELAIHSYVKPKILTQSRKANYFVFNSPSRLMLAHYEVLKSERERFLLFLKARDVAVILDESAKIKNPHSSLTRVLFELGPLFKKRIIMTGTPVANRPYDIWAQIYFLDQGKSLGSDFSQFKRNADLSNDMARDNLKQRSFENFLEDLFARISHFAVRKTKGRGTIELPEKIVEAVSCDWERNQHDLYRQIQKEMRAIVIKNGIPSEDNADQILKRMLRLVQVASNPHLIDEGYKTSPGKLVQLKDIVARISNRNEKCIVWTSFTANADWLAIELSPFGTAKIHGKLAMKRRDRALQSFVTDHAVRVLIATPGAAKEGLTLTVANHVIFYDRSFSLDDYLQAQDRIHRISQEKRCCVYNLIMRDSIDEWVDILLDSKHLAAQLAQADISLEYYRSRITYEFGTIIRAILGIGSTNQGVIQVKRRV